ncbi:MAG: TolC family protein [Caulobacteraceae bacterium]
MNRTLLALVALSPLVAGCVTATVPAPVATPPVAYEAPKPNADGLAPAALDQWWTLYGDAELNTLVTQALANAPDARTALAVLDQAAAVRRETLDKTYIPTSTFSGTATETDTQVLASTTIDGFSFTPGGTTTNLTGTFSVGWELDLFGRRAAAARTANADFYTAAFTYEATRTSLAANVAQQLFQARGLAIQLADAQETARIDKELLRIAQAKFDTGLGAGGDLDQTAANAQAADAQAESLRAQLVAAKRALLVLIGKGFDPTASLDAAANVGVIPPVPATLPGDLLRRRPDVRAAEWRIRSAMGTLKTDELALLPTLNINPGVTLTDSTGPFGATSAAWSIAGNVTAPVLDRPRLIAEIHAQRAVAVQDVIAYEQAVQTAYGDTETAFTYLDSDQRRVAMLTTAEARAASAYEKNRTGYAQGFNDLQTALTAETTWRSIRSQLTGAQITAMERSVQVFKALGGGWSPAAPAAGTPYAATAARGG